MTPTVISLLKRSDFFKAKSNGMDLPSYRLVKDRSPTEVYIYVRMVGKLCASFMGKIYSRQNE